jgi:cation diffusion facilitator CzcD-associated flavoprotein CzcO
MFNSIEALESQITEYLDQLRFFSKQSWVPTTQVSKEKVLDVIVVGAGQSGLCLAYNLKLNGIRRISIIDQQPEGKSGPWNTFAKMKNLRTPKFIPGLESGNPLLSFKSWFCSKYSTEEYDEFNYIPTHYWAEYLNWFTIILQLNVSFDTELLNLQWSEKHQCYVTAIANNGKVTTHYARKIVLATGMTSVGKWALPDEFADVLPRDKYVCTWENYDGSTFDGKSVAVIGSGASGFDHATIAVKSGCTTLDVYSRTPLPEQAIYEALWRGRDDTDIYPDESEQAPADILQPILDFNCKLEDKARVKLLKKLFKYGRSGSHPEYLDRVELLNKMNILNGYKISELAMNENQIKIIANGEVRHYDMVIYATGPRQGLEYRQELECVRNQIRLWQHCQDEKLPLGLETLPKLSKHYHFMPLSEEHQHVSSIYSMSDIVQTSIGIQCLSKASAEIANHITEQLFTQNVEQVNAFIDTL